MDLLHLVKLQVIENHQCIIKEGNFVNRNISMIALSKSALFNRNGAEIVHCNGNYGHDYPFGNEEDQYIGGSRILWNFMKSHKRNMIK